MAWRQLRRTASACSRTWNPRLLAVAGRAGTRAGTTGAGRSSHHGGAVVGRYVQSVGSRRGQHFDGDEDFLGGGASVVAMLRWPISDSLVIGHYNGSATEQDPWTD